MLNENDLPIPQDAEPCLGLERDEQMYDYYNGVLVGDAAREFEAHLLDCFTCRRKVATLDMINATLKSELMPLNDDLSLSEKIEVQPLKPQHVSTVNGERSIPYPVLLSGLGVLSIVGVGVVRLIKYARRP